MWMPSIPARTPTATRAVPPSRLTNPSPLSLAVYLLDELVSAMRSMPTDHVEDSAEHLARRVDHRSPIVKLKALRAIKYICERGDSRFRRAMSRHSGAIRSCVNHTGPPDALKGDAPHRAVREMASQAVAAVFSEGSSSSAASISSDSSSHRPAFASTLAAPAAVPIIGDASDGAPRLNKTTGTWGGTAHRLDPPPSRAFVVPERSPSSTPDAVSDFASRRPRDPRDPRDSRRAVAASPLDRLALAALTDAGASERRHRRAFRARRFGGTASGGRGVRSRRRETRAPADVLDAFTHARATDSTPRDSRARSRTRSAGRSRREGRGRTGTRLRVA